MFVRHLYSKRVLYQPSCFRYFSTPAIVIKARSPLLVRAAWSEGVKYPKELFVRRLPIENDKSYEDDTIILEEIPSSASNGEVKSISVPRRCNRIRIEASSNVKIEADDKLEVVNDFHVTSINGDVAIRSTTRANDIKIIAGGSLEFKSAVEGIKIDLKSKQGGVTAKRLHAKEVNLACKQNASIKSLYVERANIHIENGNGHFDTVQGNLNLKVDSGNAIVESLSGQFTIEAKENGTIHLEQSEPNATNSVKVGKQAQVYLSRDALPIVISGNAKVNVADPDIQFANNRLELLAPSESEGGGQLIVTGDSNSSISIRSWIESAIAKAQKRIEEKEIEAIAKSR